MDGILSSPVPTHETPLLRSSSRSSFRTGTIHPDLESDIDLSPTRLHTNLEISESKGTEEHTSASAVQDSGVQALSVNDSRSTETHELSLYPLSSILLIIWTMFIAAIFGLYFTAVTVQSNDWTTPLPWVLSDLPDILLTIFAQGHVSVTALHLSRLAVSALHNSRSTPKSWAELFWWADGNWQGPIGIFVSLYGSRRRHGRVSRTFVHFCFISIVALMTPLALSRVFFTYEDYEDTKSEISFYPSVYKPSNLENMDAYTQISMGMGSWISGKELEEVYLNGVWYPSVQWGPRDPWDFLSDIRPTYFISGGIGLVDATIPGLRFDGDCTVIDNHTTSSTEEGFKSYCQSALGGSDPHNSTDFRVGGVLSGPAGINLTFAYCSLTPYWTPLNLANGPNHTSIYSAHVLINSSTILGLAQSSILSCTSSLSSGIALVETNDFTLTPDSSTYVRFIGRSSATFQGFDSYIAKPVNLSKQVARPLVDPLFAFLLYVTSWSHDRDGGKYHADMSGFIRGMNLTQNISSDPKNLARHIWRATAHIAGGMAIFAQSDDTSFNATKHLPGIRRYLSFDPFSVGWAGLLITVWLIQLIRLSAKMLRPAFGKDLNSYAAARLLASRTDLVDGHSCGDMSENPLMSEQFSRVGDSRPDASVGRVEAGGKEPLLRGRLFA